MLDSDTVWAPGALREMLRPFADPRVGGVTPRQAIFDVGDDPVRRLADWIEDLRYLLTVPAQSVFGQVGCLAGRTIAYRRTAFEPAVAALVRQTVFGMPQHVGDDRVLTNELLRAAGGPSTSRPRGWRPTRPPDWRTFWRQQLRWGRSSQRETLLSLPLAVAPAGGVRDVRRPTSSRRSRSTRSSRSASRTRSAPGTGRTGLPVAAELVLGYVGMIVSIGVRQIPHLRRRPRDVAAAAAVRAAAHVRDGADPHPRLRDDAAPVVVDARGRPAYEVRHEAVRAESAHA